MVKVHYIQPSSPFNKDPHALTMSAVLRRLGLSLAVAEPLLDLGALVAAAGTHVGGGIHQDL